MAIILGERLFGKCDVVPELFHVSTAFFHVNYLPLFPLGSRLILSEQGDDYTYVAIPFSFKSLLYAWVRTAFFLGGAIGWLFTAISFNSDRDARDFGHVGPITCAILFTALYLFAMIYPRRSKPSYARAAQLAALAKFSDTGWAALNVLYGRDIADRA